MALASRCWRSRVSTWATLPSALRAIRRAWWWAWSARRAAGSTALRRMSWSKKSPRISWLRRVAMYHLNSAIRAS